MHVPYGIRACPVSTCTGPYIVSFGVPNVTQRYDLEVQFIGTATRVTKALRRQFGGIVPAAYLTSRVPRVFNATDAPAVASCVVWTSSGTSLVGIGGTLVVLVNTLKRESGLLTTPAVVNHASVSSTFVDHRNGSYRWSYTVGDGDASVATGALTATLALADARAPVGVTSDAVTLPLNDVTVNTVRPVLSFTHAPLPHAAVSTTTVTLTACCTTPTRGCAAFRYSLNGTAAADTVGTTAVPGSTATPQATVTWTVGPFRDGDEPVVSLWAIDDSGNAPLAALTLSWRVDQVPPIASVLSAPAARVRDPLAPFVFGCSKTDCVYDYAVDAGPRVRIAATGSSTDNGSGNGSATSTGPTLDTVRVNVRPLSGGHVVPAGAALAFDAVVVVNNATLTPPLPAHGVNVTLAVDGGNGGGASVSMSPSLSGVVTGASPGRHVLHATALTSDGGVDVTPTVFVWYVGGAPPAVTVVVAPPRLSSTPSGTAHFVLAATTTPASFVYAVSTNDSAPPPASRAWTTTRSAVVDVDGLVAGVPYTLFVHAVDGFGGTGPAVVWSWVTGPCPAVVTAVVTSVTAYFVDYGRRAIVWTGVCDDGCGGAEWEYRLDGGAWSRVAVMDVLVSVAVAQSHVVDVRAAVPSGCDHDLPLQPHVTVAWVEFAPPPGVASFVVTPSTLSAVPYADFVLASSSAAVESYLQYAVTEGGGGPSAAEWLDCDTIVRVGPLPPGTYHMRVRTVDVTGSVFGPEAAYSWTVVAGDGSSVAVPVDGDGTHVLQVRVWVCVVGGCGVVFCIWLAAWWFGSAVARRCLAWTVV